MRRPAPVLAAALLLLAAAGYPQTANWEPAIAAFEKRDIEDPPAKDGILFVGSSSIRFWNTDHCFPGRGIINRGFGGSQTADVLHYFDRIVLPYEPRIIVLYAGDNDIAAGKSPEQVVADTEAFIERVRAALPETRVVYIAIKPSLARWHLVDAMREVNRAIERLADNNANLAFVDVDTPMLGDDGKPREELFIADGLHLSEAGYQLWTQLLRPHLVEPAG